MNHDDDDDDKDDNEDYDNDVEGNDDDDQFARFLEVDKIMMYRSKTLRCMIHEKMLREVQSMIVMSRSSVMWNIIVWS